MKFSIVAAGVFFFFVVVVNGAEISRQECMDQGGTVVGDIGDGAIFAPDYLCLDTNEPPTDAVVALEGEPRSIEGEVCCGGTGSGIVLVTIGEGDPPATGVGGVDVPTCPDINDGCMNEENLQQCQTLIDTGCTNILLMESCPLQFACGDDAMPIGNVVRDQVTREICTTALGGEIVGDIGDGAIFAETYICESNGLPPLANIIQDTTTTTTSDNAVTTSQQIAIEGEVCCGNGDDVHTVVTMDPLPVMEDLTREECTNTGGNIVGDIGDGAIFTETYICESSGLPPIAWIIQDMTGNAPVAIEGEVCCGPMMPMIVNRQECTNNLNGIVVSDVGDGSSRRPEYRCDSNGEPILAIVVPIQGEPMSDEGEVCCGAQSVIEEVTREECTNDLDGIIVQDIGDGSSRRPGYLCESSGEPILAIVVPAEGEPIAREGEVCCAVLERSELTRDECVEVGGIVVGDIGDGFIFDDAYVCDSTGLPPIANIIQDATGTDPIATEGEVCCGSFPMRDEVTREECTTTLGGSIIGDIGDGAIFEDMYLCESNGMPPIANIIQDTTGTDPIAIEGEVCCGVVIVTMDPFPVIEEVTREECTDVMGGSIVGDIGDGAIFEESYICESNGMPPLANIIQDTTGTEPVAIEGEVCCGPPLDRLPAVRDGLTREECLAQGSSIVGDIGDGAIFEDTYICESSGLPPVANIIQDATGTEPIAIEGEVCCGAPGVDDVDVGTTPTDPAAPVVSNPDESVSSTIGGGNDAGIAMPGTSGNVTRDEVTRDECKSQGGSIVGDIGDGAIFEESYVCESSGLPPIANIIQDATGSEPIAIEGEVCCIGPMELGSDTATNGSKDAASPIADGSDKDASAAEDDPTTSGGAIAFLSHGSVTLLLQAVLVAIVFST